MDIKDIKCTRYSSLPQVTRVHDLSNELDSQFVKPNRGGIILYTICSGVLYFGLAVDTETHDLTDAGGTIDYSIDRTTVRGCIREFMEETLDIFETVTEDQLQSCPVVHDKKNMIIFMRVSDDPNEISRKLVERYKIITEQKLINAKLRGRKARDLPEVCGITWLTQEAFNHSLETPGIMYSRVRKFLSQVKDLYEFL